TDTEANPVAVLDRVPGTKTQARPGGHVETEVSLHRPRRAGPVGDPDLTAGATRQPRTEASLGVGHGRDRDAFDGAVHANSSRDADARFRDALPIVVTEPPADDRSGPCLAQARAQRGPRRHAGHRAEIVRPDP